MVQRNRRKRRENWEVKLKRGKDSGKVRMNERIVI